MNQSQQAIRWWKDNWPVLALLATAIVIATTGILGYWRSWQRPLWDWLDLLIIPLVLALGAFWFNTQTRKSEQELAKRERENDRAIAEERAREDALQRYLDRMSELVLDKKLRESKRDDAVRATARARTLTVLRSLDGNRKGQVARFLHEADLIGTSRGRQVIGAIIDLETADLSGADLSSANLHDADLSHANLSGAILSDANLRHANLSGANLSGASLSDAYMIDANLSDAYMSGATPIGAWLTSANLSGANLSLAKLDSAHLRFADLSNANLSGATLSDAYMRDANLTGANLSVASLKGTYLRDANLNGANLLDAKEWTNEQSAQAKSLIGATLPDGTVMTEEAWEEFKKSYGQ
jgi:uncharacterized protein YjbI with pentapeptide repeats